MHFTSLVIPGVREPHYVGSAGVAGAGILATGGQSGAKLDLRIDFDDARVGLAALFRGGDGDLDGLEERGARLHVGLVREAPTGHDAGHALVIDAALSRSG